MMRILLVDDNTALIQVMAKILEGVGQLQFATQGAAALTRMREAVPDLVLLDADMPGMSGHEVCAAMRADPLLADVPVIFVTGHGGAEDELRGLEAGAVDFIAKPVSAPLLLARVRTQLRIKRLTDELRELATTDALTGVRNRRSFDLALESEWKRGRRAAAPLALLMIDVDHFKRYNDHHGHPAGDGCLRAIAGALRGATLRPGDTVARIGGEEFAILLPQTPLAGAREVARRVLDAVGALGLPHGDSPTAPHVTVSIGLGLIEPPEAAAGTAAQAPSPGQPGPMQAALLERTDRALYLAKQAGRARAWQSLARGAGDGACDDSEICRWTPGPCAPA